jgi:hypothetical protein
MLTYEQPGNTSGITESNIAAYFWDFANLDIILGTDGATIYIDLDDLPNNGGITPGSEEDVTFYTRSSAIDDFEVIPYVYNAGENRYEITVSHFCQFCPCPQCELPARGAELLHRRRNGRQDRDAGVDDAERDRAHWLPRTAR